MNRFRAATLSVGTELTDGQIVDRNSAWISQRLTDVGINVVEHRAVPDERDLIRKALSELSSACELLFVTGGLGPTSDDFTRELIAETYGRPLRFHQPSWDHVQNRLRARGVPIRDSQKQQCDFPEGADVLENPMGTANGFALSLKELQVFVLPGPPAEIAAIWERGIDAKLATLVPQNERERLLIWRCLGRGESEFAEIAEEILGSLGLRIGYRAHAPYVETKVWVRDADLDRVKDALVHFESRIRPWLVNKDGADVAVDVLEWAEKPGRKLIVQDAATSGFLAERLSQKLQELKLAGRDLDVTIETRLMPPTDARLWVDSCLARSSSADVAILALAVDVSQDAWAIGLGAGLRRELSLERPVFRLDCRAERSRKHVTEKSLHAFSRFLGADFGET